MSIKVTMRNRFNKDKAAFLDYHYYKSDGTISAGISIGWSLVETYIPVSGDAVVLSGVDGADASICAYDADKHFLSAQEYRNSRTKSPIVFRAEGMKFVRFSLRTEQKDTAQLEEGTVATPYIPPVVEISRLVCNGKDITEIRDGDRLIWRKDT